MFDAELLFANRMPVKTKHRTFYDAFSGMLNEADELYIAVGYITAESLAELKRLAELNGINYLCLTIGMHHVDKFTRSQYNAAKALGEFLMKNGRGEVRIVTSFMYHGKMYLAGKNSEIIAGIIGSDNLSSIMNDSRSAYEASLLVRDRQIIADMKSFADSLNKNASILINEYDTDSFRDKDVSALTGQEGVEHLETNEAVRTNLTGLSFEIPISTEPKSSLNIYFGEGRRQLSGVIIPRHWYEAELIVPKNITQQEGYPQAKTESAVFDVITDDGYRFLCKVSGTNSKNLRSEGDLKILGRWLKGRMEEAGVLKAGEPVTDEVLSDYGRNTVTLRQTSVPNVWYIDFSVKK